MYIHILCTHTNNNNNNIIIIKTNTNKFVPSRQAFRGKRAGQAGRQAGRRGGLRPISLLRSWIPEGLTQAES